MFLLYCTYNRITLYSDEQSEGEYNSILNLRFRAQTWGMYYFSVSLSLSIDHWSNLVLHTYLITKQKLVKHSVEPVLSDHHIRTPLNLLILPTDFILLSSEPVPDLPLCLSIGPRWPGGPSSWQIFFLRWIFAYVVQFYLNFKIFWACIHDCL